MTQETTQEKTEETTIEYIVGGDIISWCTKCKLMLNHTIVALVDEFPKKAKCKTCNGNHNYRSEEPKAKTPGGTRRTKKTDFENQMAKLEEGYDFSKAKKYSMKGNFKKEQIIEHSDFGIGFILNVPESKKVEILFKDGPKLLVQNR